MYLNKYGYYYKSALIISFFLSVCLPKISFANELTHEYGLDNGLKLIVREDHRAPVVTMQIWYKSGSA